ncbi:EFR1 family ferrodoxin [Lutibacter sp. TH_r2]|uniref:EFR1 family ferrodoxin n=1 Tax=Lutibacter sp. TH_r2 TaxID=3082083 RepID=UPI0029545A2E|nr:EFR1 family ferrodoxin [Lutibacter sp. TH_r2]MDV7186059.1 EFR1 family ferrodoxin [Lutibacter sp. TH_r2]
METLSLVYYSPTGTTQKIVREIGQNTGLKLIAENNLAENNFNLQTETSNNSLTIIGLPVYGGRLPLAALENLKKLKSNQSPVVIVVVYGNRDFDDALLELKQITSDCGFKVVAGAVFIGEHSYSTDEKPVAKDRPDAKDLETCKNFAKKITSKLKRNKNLNKLSEVVIPGNFPYKERNQLPVTLYPETNNAICNQCGTCVDVCPTNAITIEDTVITNGELCTWCCACVKYCPHEARIFSNSTINTIQNRLYQNFSTRKEPVFFM